MDTKGHEKFKSKFRWTKVLRKGHLFIILNAKAMIIEIVPYNPAWPKLFEKETELLQQTLGDLAEKIHHIGSTAVQGLAAKPIVDIIIEVSSLEKLDVLNDKMKSIGYEPKGEFGIPRRRYFQKGGSNRTHQIHAFQSGDSHVIRHLVFRDYLRANPETAKEYAQLKSAIAKTCDNDIGRYCDGKDEYVKQLEAKALQAHKFTIAGVAVKREGAVPRD